MIKHILRDGTVLQDITGHVVKQKDAPLVYQIMERMNKEKEGANDIRGSKKSQ